MPRRSARLSKAPTPTIDDLPDDLLARCLASLSQKERFQSAALVCKRWQRACLAPQLVRTVTADITWGPSFLRRLRALRGFLLHHAPHVRSLDLATHASRRIDVPTSADATALAAACLAACGATGSLQELRLYTHAPLPSLDWLPGLTALQQLRLAGNGALVLPAGISRLTALSEAELTGYSVTVEGPALPPALARLTLSDDSSTHLPPQMATLTVLSELELNRCSALTADGLALLARLPALRNLLYVRSDGDLPSFFAPTQIEALEVMGVIETVVAAIEAGLGRLSRLTHLTLIYECWPERVPPALANLSRLQNLDLHADHFAGGPAAGCLPPGPWLASLRRLGVLWDVLAVSSDVLRGAPRLEEIRCDPLPAASFDDAEASSPLARRRWQAFWSLLETLPALRCLDLGCYVEHTTDLLHALLLLRRRRPALEVRLPEVVQVALHAYQSGLPATASEPASYCLS